MLILSNCLTQIADEGGLKLANSLVKRIKKADCETTVVTYDRKSPLSDYHLSVNKFMLNRKLISLIRCNKHTLLYIPFPSKSLPMAVRIWIVSLFARKRLKVMLIRQYPLDTVSKLFLKASKAEFIVFSAEAKEFYEAIVNNKITYLKTGVDIHKYAPVSTETVRKLKTAYGFDPDRPVILHVGHMKEGRNVRQLMKLNKSYQIVLVISSLSKERQDNALRVELEQCENIRIIDTYLPNIEELYQLSDVYFFPVMQRGHCIDVPLSCMEAASCNKPVVTTSYGEMRQLIGEPGFFAIEDFEENALNTCISAALSAGEVNTRSSVLAYNWDLTVNELVECKEKGDCGVLWDNKTEHQQR